MSPLLVILSFFCDVFPWPESLTQGHTMLCLGISVLVTPANWLKRGYSFSFCFMLWGPDLLFVCLSISLSPSFHLHAACYLIFFGLLYILNNLTRSKLKIYPLKTILCTTELNSSTYVYMEDAGPWYLCSLLILLSPCVQAVFRSLCKH